jgi:hypothetical protein
LLPERHEKSSTRTATPSLSLDLITALVEVLFVTRPGSERNSAIVMSRKLTLQTNASVGLNLNAVAPSSLTLCQSSIPKKYRGDDDDPHFIPASPIISRQELTAQEEEELKRICALVLANVPHSDDMSDDPLKYIAAQIQEGQKASTKPERTSDAARKAETTTSTTQQFLDVQTDSATPSEASRRGTFTATDYSTPLTSAGITPGESARRFSDATRKSLTGAKKPGSNLRNDSNNVAGGSAMSSTGVRSFDAHKPSSEAEAIKKTLRLITDGSSRPLSDSVRPMEQPPRPIRFSAPDLNKRLPPPPPLEATEFEEHKQPHISRLMKSIRKKKSMTSDSRSQSNGSSPPTPQFPAVEIPKTPYPHQFAAQEPPKKRFRIPLFHRRQRPADVLVT